MKLYCEQAERIERSTKKRGYAWTPPLRHQGTEEYLCYSGTCYGDNETLQCYGNTCYGTHETLSYYGEESQGDKDEADGLCYADGYSLRC